MRSNRELIPQPARELSHNPGLGGSGVVIFAEILAVKPGTVKSRIHRGRESLKAVVLAWRRGEDVNLGPSERVATGLLETVNQWTRVVSLPLLTRELST